MWMIELSSVRIKANLSRYFSISAQCTACAADLLGQLSLCRCYVTVQEVELRSEGINDDVFYMRVDVWLVNTLALSSSQGCIINTRCVVLSSAHFAMQTDSDRTKCESPESELESRSSRTHSLAMD